MSPDDPGIVVVKVGGGDALDMAAIWDDIAALHEAGVPLVIVHGGNAALTRLQSEVGRPARFVTDGDGRTSRYTDADAMRLFTMAYPGEQNTRHVVALQGRGVSAVGLTGVDGGILRATRRSTIRILEDGKKQVLRDDHVGRLDEVDATLIRMLVEKDYVPVLTVPALAVDDGVGVAVNVDGDTVVSRLAVALSARCLVFLSDVPGLLADVSDAGSLIRRVSTDAAWDTAVAAGGGRMRRKVEGARRGVEGGIGTVVFAPGTVVSPISSALDGEGTHFLLPTTVEEAAQ